MSSLRELILVADDIKREEVDLTAEWGCKVWVREMTVDEYDEWWKRQVKDPTLGRQHAVVLVTEDADRNRVFQPDDEALFGKRGHRPFHKLWLAAAKVNRLLGNSEPEPKDEPKGDAS